jgi:hypothetical protein
MVSLLALGIVAEVSILRAEMTQMIDRAKLEYAAEFREWLDIAFDDPVHQRVLVLPPDTVVNGDLEVDWSDALRGKQIVAIVARGDLTVKGNVRNADLEGGPLLFVGGTLRARHLDKGGANFVILGNVELEGIALCEYNHGVLRVGRDLKAQALINLDHDVLVSGKTSGKAASSEESALREVLVPEVFDLANDPEATWPDSSLIRKRMAAGKPVLR